jgi:ligand-binding SRPBCC domain-containing protein
LKDGEIEMQDIVSYLVPFGLLGRIMNKSIIEKKIKEIFNYKKSVLEKMFA